MFSNDFRTAVRRAVKPGILLRGLSLMAGMALIAWILAAGAAHFSNLQWIDVGVRGQGWIGIMLFLAVGTVAVGAGVPRTVLGFGAGYAFGLVWGVVWALAASMIGCIGAFFYARLLARSLLRRRFPGRVQKLDAFLQDHPFSMTIMVRSIPWANNLLTNLIAGVSSVRPAAFFIGSLVGYTPMTVVSVLFGSGTRVDGMWQIAASVVLFVVSTVGGGALYYLRKERDLDVD